MKPDPAVPRVLILEVNGACVDKTVRAKLTGGSVLEMTPPIGEDYWLFRVKVGRAQSIIAFPKFGTIGIGFARETDWNTNLPYTSSASDIWRHIKHNKGSETIADDDCLKAIEMLRAAAKEARA